MNGRTQADPRPTIDRDTLQAKLPADAMSKLLKGETDTPRFASRVNPDRCLKCRICETVCPHGAIRMTEEGAVSDPAFCQACGFCAAACPVHAAELTSFSDRQLLDQARVAFSELREGEPLARRTQARSGQPLRSAKIALCLCGVRPG